MLGFRCARPNDAKSWATSILNGYSAFGESGYRFQTGHMKRRKVKS